VLNKYVDIVHSFAADGARQRRLADRERRHLVRQVETVLIGPLLSFGSDEPPTAHAFGCGIKNQEIFILIRDDDRFTQVL